MTTSPPWLTTTQTFMLGFYASYVIKGLSVPKCVEFAIGGCRVLGSVSIVDCEGEDEVEFDVLVYGHVDELDSLTNILKRLEVTPVNEIDVSRKTMTLYVCLLWLRLPPQTVL